MTGLRRGSARIFRACIIFSFLHRGSAQVCRACFIFCFFLRIPRAFYFTLFYFTLFYFIFGFEFIQSIGT